MFFFLVSRKSKWKPLGPRQHTDFTDFVNKLGPYEWKRFDSDDLKQEHLIYYCNMVWVQCKLKSGKKWVLDGTLNYEIIPYLHCFNLKYKR